MKHFRFSLCARVLLLALCLGNAPARAADPPAPMSQPVALQRFLNEITTFVADFEQIQFDDHGNEQARHEGTLALKRPGKFRWMYQTPYEQLMVCDAQQIWNYEPDLDQASVRSAGDILRDTPAALLAQTSALNERFNLIEGAREGDARLFTLTPKSANADFQQVELWLKDSGVPSKMRLRDPLGGHTQITFSKVQRNVRIDDARFVFTPPQGTEIVTLD
ncbi:outer membrane lipoprotein chaperone LolA [Sinimarinibacterium sp. NLF-5-8]|uniref:outer membrane lipoprotein chaperone LolA n=1 Tax=Sinimarinibacterium sp. NLF-5-8 TaxID=2698684 RepID=UPI00137B9B68|nr:outer membrane lipoprotein chaperone LolA [Sinimarinibacterium sp. NLF-5-8]QHS09452.1 outer membrane lipoprotein chaperone LolA [Sinimarinibacterium sp. NLF-5-8]